MRSSPESLDDIQESAERGVGPSHGGNPLEIADRNDYRPELELMVCCARSTISEEIAERAVALLGTVDWDVLLRLTTFHRVEPMVFHGLRAIGIEQLPENVQSFLHGRYVGAAALNLRLVQELHDVQRRLDRVGLPVLFFKGPVLAELAYKSLGLRACTDIDLLIRESDFGPVRDLLNEAGYEPAKPLDGESTVETRSLRLTGQCAFIHEEHPWSIDVHTALMPPGYSYPMGFSTLYSRSLEVTVGGGAARTFSPEDLIQILCLHGVKNRWEALKYVCDVAELTGSQPQLDWDQVTRTAQSVRGERILNVGLRLAHHLLSAPLPKDVVARFEKDAQVRNLTDQIAEYLGHSHEEMISSKERLRFHLKIQETLANKVRYGVYALRRRLTDRTR